MSVLTLILAGGQGRELSCLVDQRGKPALPLGGKYRVIDFPLSNAVNSGLRRIAVLAQYQAQPMITHLGQGEPWGLDQPGAGLEVWLAGLERTGQALYLGTADAVYQNSRYIKETGCDRVLILAGDHIFRQDFRPMLHLQQQTGADGVVAAMEVPLETAHRYGQLAVDGDGRITRFVEKVQPPESQLVSQGIYLFRTECLLERLAEDARDPDSHHDFGRDVLPRMVMRDRLYAALYSGYWVDVGSVQSYWRANMDLLAATPALNLDDPAWKFYTRQEDLPPARVVAEGTAQASLLSEGCLVEGQVIRSVLSPGVKVEPGAMVRDSVVMQDGLIRAGAMVERCIIDQGVEVGSRAILGADLGDTPNADEPEALGSGISVIGAGARIPAGVMIGRNCRIDPGVGEPDFTGKQVPSGGSVKKAA